MISGLTYRRRYSEPPEQEILSQPITSEEDDGCMYCHPA